MVLLSRSGASSTVALELVNELKAAGINVATPACDISDSEALNRTFVDISEQMPPVAGCIQASMVLQDGQFRDMSFPQWEAAVRPKVDGSWNLHKLLPHSMDFFILLSSVSGICGQHGQSNYAAGNTYLDALAHYRVARNEKAISINLGAMVSDGYLVENEKVMERLLSYGSMLPITRDDLNSLLDYYCDPSLDVLSLETCQSVVGINTPQNIRALGRDLPSWLQQPFFRRMHQIPGDQTSQITGTSSASTRDFKAEFCNAVTLVDAGALVSEALVIKMARSLSSISDYAELDLRSPIHSYGVDSLLAVEVRSWIASQFQADVPIFEILSGTSFATLGMTVASKSLLRKGEWFS